MPRKRAAAGQVKPEGRPPWVDTPKSRVGVRDKLRNAGASLGQIRLVCSCGTVIEHPGRRRQRCEKCSERAKRIWLKKGHERANDKKRKARQARKVSDAPIKLPFPGLRALWPWNPWSGHGG